jgi:uncharacterized protein YbbC (DUF1343 family)
MHCRLFAIVFLLAPTALSQVQLGIDCLRDDGFKLLEKKRIGLVGNPASVDLHRVRTVDLLVAAPNVKLVALFAPEHGIYGDAYAGEAVKDRTDAHTGLPAYSIHGEHRAPTTQAMKTIDALVFDLQDIGSRSYTFVSSMKACMHECAKHDKEFIVLDRPNPLGGNRIEGPSLTKEFESFIGYIYVPYVHGLTIGELAQFVRATELPDYHKLHVVKMQGWKRDMLWDDTGLMWIPSSPHVPHARLCAYYAATGFLGELKHMSNGCGYTMPFELAGAPFIKGELLADALNNHWNAPDLDYRPRAAGRTPLNLPASHPAGLYFRPVFYTPFYGTFEDDLCQGVQVYMDERKTENLVEVNFKILEAVGAPEIFSRASKSEIRFFDITCGSDEPRKYLTEMRDLKPLFAKWKHECEEFRLKRRPYLLYE